MLTLLGIHVITRRRVQKRRGKGGGQHTRQTLEKSPTSKLYTSWAHVLCNRNKFAPRGEEENGGVQCPRGFSCYPAVRTGSSNTPFFFFFFFCRGQLPQTSARSKQYLPVNVVRLVFIRRNFHESWCRKLPAI